MYDKGVKKTRGLRVRLGARKRDHAHKCCVCGKTYPCKFFTLADCKKKGVFKAIQVNGDGPYCPTCRRREMLRREAELAKMKNESTPS